MNQSFLLCRKKTGSVKSLPENNSILQIFALSQLTDWGSVLIISVFSQTEIHSKLSPGGGKDRLALFLNAAIELIMIVCAVCSCASLIARTQVDVHMRRVCVYIMCTRRLLLVRGCSASFIIFVHFAIVCAYLYIHARPN